MRVFLVGIVLIFATGFGSVVAPRPALAADAVVGDGTAASCTSEALIDALADGGSVTFSCGPDNLSIDVPQLAISVSVTIDGGDRITLDGGGDNRVLRVSKGRRLTLRNIAVAGGFVGNTVGIAGQGGNILNNGGTVSLRNTVIEGGQARQGGGVASINGGRIIASGTTFRGNGAGDAGAAIYDAEGSASTTLTDVTIEDHSAMPAISHVGGELTVRNSDFDNNSSALDMIGGTASLTGGVIENSGMDGLIVSGGQLTLTDLAIANSGGRGLSVLGGDVRVMGSTIQGNAGGISVDDGSLNVVSSTIDGNSAVTGAGVYVAGGDIALTNTTISGNTATGDAPRGGGVFVSGGTTSLTNSTIAKNSAPGAGQGGGVFVDGGVLEMANTIVGANTAGTNADCKGTIASLGYNLIQSVGGCDITGDTVGNVIRKGPRIGALATNGGQTRTHALRDGSPALNAGNPTWPGDSDVSCATTDQRGIVRPKGAACDIGAYEFVPTTDETAPTIFVTDQTVEAVDANGASVAFDASAKDDVDGSLPVTCDATSGDTFPLGDTVVTCTASDTAGNEGTGRFTVSVVDTTAPVIAPHDNITVFATAPDGSTVTYSAPPTIDAVDGTGIAACIPTTGEHFDVGTTTVTCQASDAAGNVADATTFTVTVAVNAGGGIVVADDMPADPYPATIDIAGLDGVIDNVVVTLRGISHSHPDDLDILLVSPDGKQTLLLSDSGGSPDISDVTLTFDDDAATRLPNGGSLTSGTWKPSNFEPTVDVFDGVPDATRSVSLDALAGGTPNGFWTLYVVDDQAKDEGSIAGWELYISTKPAPANARPTLDPIAAVTLDEGTTQSVAVRATDPDGDPITLTTANLPGFATFTNNGDGTGDLVLTPDFNQSGSYADVRITASDGVRSHSRTFTITVSDVPRAPVLAEIADVTVVEGDSVDVGLSAIDADGSSLTFSTSVLPGFATLTNHDDGTATISVSPVAGDAGTYDVTVSVADDQGLTDEDTFVITVTAEPLAPELAAIGNQTVNEGTTLNVSIAAIDGDSASLTFSGSNLPSFASLVNNGNKTATLSLTPGFNDARTYSSVVVTVSDGTLSDSETFTITVVDAPSDTVAPVTTAAVTPAPNASGWSRTATTVHLTATDNVGVRKLTYSASGASAIPSTTVNGASATLSVSDAGLTTVNFYATDTAGNVEAVKRVSVRIDTSAPSVTSPAARIIEGQLGTATAPFRVTWTGSDLYSGIARYKLERSVNGGAWTTVALSTPNAREATVQLAVPATHQFRVSAIDRAGNESVVSTGALIQLSTQRETSQWLAYTGSWTTDALTGSFNGAVKHASASGAKATFTFTAQSVAWVSTVGPNRGIAEIWLDGNKIATVDLYAPVLKPRTVTFEKSGLSAGKHKLEVRVTGTKSAAASGTRVDIDEFLIVQ